MRALDASGVGSVAALAVALALSSPLRAAAQELEPGAYWPIPSGLNILTIANSLSWGDVTFDPSAPIEDARATIDTTMLAFARAFSLAGRSANASVSWPINGGQIDGLYQGAPAEASRFGQGDPRLRLALNLYGAPAMTPAAFRDYTLDTLFGVSLTVVPPLGQYDGTKLINVGLNRWSFKPEIGFVRANGKWVLEAIAGVWLFTDNTDYFVGHTREQDLITNVQFHLTYRFSPTMWLAGDVNFYTGGRVTVDGQPNVDLQHNSRIGTTFSKALARGHALRLSVSQGAYTTIGNDFTSIAIGYNYAWAR